MISASEILQIHRCIACSLEKEPPAPFRLSGVVQLLDWITLLVAQDQIRNGYEPCIFPGLPSCSSSLPRSGHFTIIMP